MAREASKKGLKYECLNRVTKEAKSLVLTGHVRRVLQERVPEALPSDGTVDEAGRLVHVLTQTSIR